jgi:hypothetical protein
MITKRLSTKKTFRRKSFIKYIFFGVFKVRQSSEMSIGNVSPICSFPKYAVIKLLTSNINAHQMSADSLAQTESGMEWTPAWTSARAVERALVQAAELASARAEWGLAEAPGVPAAELASARAVELALERASVLAAEPAVELSSAQTWVRAAEPAAELASAQASV